MNKYQILAKGRNGKMLLELLEDVKREVADIRTPLKIRPEITNEVRLVIIEAVDIFLVDRLKCLIGDIAPPDVNEHL